MCVFFVFFCLCHKQAARIFFVLFPCGVLGWFSAYESRLTAEKKPDYARRLSFYNVLRPSGEQLPVVLVPGKTARAATWDQPVNRKRENSVDLATAQTSAKQRRKFVLHNLCVHQPATQVLTQNVHRY